MHSAFDDSCSIGSGRGHTEMSRGKAVTRRSFAILCASPLIAGPFQEPFKITDNVDLVLVDVSVKDSHGRLCY